MTIMWTGFPSSRDALSTDVLVGLSSSPANVRINASSFLFVANNLDDVADALTSFNNVSPLGTKGDTLWFDGTNNAAIGVGSEGQLFAVGASSVVGWIDNPGLLAANNLDDLADLSTALDNLGLNTTNDVTFNTVATTVSQTSPSFISTGLNKVSVTDAITAHSGGGQGSAVALTTAINRVTVVAAGGDSVKLPVSAAGENVVVINAAAVNALDCYPFSGDAINALSANAFISIAAGTSLTFKCAVAGIWNT